MWYALKSAARGWPAAVAMRNSYSKIEFTKRKYRIAPTSASSDKRRHPSMLLLEGRPRVVYPKVDRAEADVPTKAQIDAELAKMRSMTPDEAAAARAVTEAEIAIAEAEEAAREAEAAEADGEAA